MVVGPRARAVLAMMLDLEKFDKIRKKGRLLETDGTTHIHIHAPMLGSIKEALLVVPSSQSRSPMAALHADACEDHQQFSEGQGSESGNVVRVQSGSVTDCVVDTMSVQHQWTARAGLGRRCFRTRRRYDEPYKGKKLLDFGKTRSFSLPVCWELDRSGNLTAPLSCSGCSLHLLQSSDMCPV